MPTVDLLTLFVRPIHGLGLPYMVTGGLASVLYGEPRLTHDVDLLLELGPGGMRSLSDAFAPPEYYCPPEEVLRIEAGRPRRGHFNLIHLATGLKADIFLMGTDPLHRWALARRRLVDAGGGIWLAPPEYVILRKFLFYREGGGEKHLRDIRGMVAVSGSTLDWVELEQRIGELGLQKEWQAAGVSAGGSGAPL